MRISKKQLISFALLSCLSLMFVFFFAPTHQVQAQTTGLYNNQVGLNEIGQQYGNKIPEDPRLTAAKLIRVILSFLGLIFLVLVLFAGFKWMTSGGNQEQIAQSKKMLINAAIGLIIVLVAWSIASYIIYVLNRLIIDQAVDPLPH